MKLNPEKLFTGLMWAFWLMLFGLTFSLSSKTNPNYGPVDGNGLPILGIIFLIVAAFAFYVWLRDNKWR